MLKTDSRIVHNRGPVGETVCHYLLLLDSEWRTTLCKEIIMTYPESVRDVYSQQPCVADPPPPPPRPLVSAGCLCGCACIFRVRARVPVSAAHASGVARLASWARAARQLVTFSDSRRAWGVGRGWWVRRSTPDRDPVAMPCPLPALGCRAFVPGGAAGTSGRTCCTSPS